MASDEHTLQRAIGLIYTVVDGDTSWNQVAASISSLFSSPFVYVTTSGGGAAVGKEAVSHRSRCTDQATAFDTSNPLTAYFAAHVGRLLDLNNIQDREDTFGRAFLAEVVRPGRHAHMVAMNAQNDQGFIHSVILGRTADQAAFDKEEMSNLCRLAAHVGRVAEVVSWGRNQACLEVPSVPALISEFGLTPQEARVAQEIARGLSISQITEALGVGRETVRFHIRHILDKSDNASCADFVSNLERFVAPGTPYARDHQGDR